VTGKNACKVFVRAGEPVGCIGGTDSRYRREGDGLVVLPDERWGNPLFAETCLDDSDFHVHARLTLDRLAGTGASVLLGGHYHYSHSRPEGNHGFRISLDEDITPMRKTLDKRMYIVHGPTNPRKHWNLTDSLTEKAVIGAADGFFRAGEPFDVDIIRRGDELTFQIDGKEVFRTDLSDGSRIGVGRCGDAGWPISVGFLPGQGVLRIHDFYAEGAFPGPTYPTTDAWLFNSLDYLHYRIPGVCTTPNGRVLAFTEARRAILSRGWEWESDWVYDEVHCVMKSSDDNGQTWSQQQTILDVGVSYEARDPSPLVDWDTGEVFLFTGMGPWVVSSRDDGRTWSEPRSLAYAGPGDFKDLRPGVGNSAIQLRHGRHRGRLLVALYQKHIIGLIYSDDHGETWQPGALTSFSGACEHSIAELSDGRVIVSPRIGPRVGERPAGRLFLESHDGGCTLGKARYEPAIPIPGQGEILGFDPPDESATGASRPLVFCGGADGKTNLTMTVSLDDGNTWPISRVIDTGSAANLALVALPKRQVGVLYERDKYRRVSFQRVDLDALITEHPNQ